MSMEGKDSSNAIRDHLLSVKSKLRENKGNVASIVADGIIGLIGLVNPPAAIALYLTKKAEELRKSKKKGAQLQNQLDDIWKEIETISDIKDIQTELEIIILLAKQDIIDRIDDHDKKVMQRFDDLERCIAKIQLMKFEKDMPASLASESMEMMGERCLEPIIPKSLQDPKELDELETKAIEAMTFKVKEFEEAYKQPMNSPEFYNLLGIGNFKIGNWDVAMKLWETALSLYMRDDNKEGEAVCLGNIGLVYWVQGKWNEAEHYHKKAMELAEQLGNPLGLAAHYGNLGTVCIGQGKWEEAEKYISKHLELAEQLGNPLGMTQGYCNLEIVYKNQGKWNEAEEYFKKALKLAEQLGNPLEMANQYGNLGVVHSDKGKWEEAEYYHKKARELHEKLGNPLGITQSYCNLGIVYKNQEKWDEAEEYFKKALKLAEQLGNPLEMANQYGNLGTVYSNQEKWDEAEEYYNKALKLHKKLGNPIGIAQIHVSLGILCKEREQYEESFEYLIIAFSISDSLGAEPMKQIMGSHLVDLKEKVGEDKFMEWLDEFTEKNKEHVLKEESDNSDN